METMEIYIAKMAFRAIVPHLGGPTNMVREHITCDVIFVAVRR